VSAVFGNPGAAIWLAAPAIAAVLLWVFARTRRRITRAFVGAPLLSRMLVSVDPDRRRTKGLLFLAALLALAVAMMRPHWGAVYEKIEKKGIDVVFLVDVSKSMLADDVKPNRLERVVAEIKHFIESAPLDDRVALVCFAGLSHVQCPLTHDFSAFRLFLDDVDPKLIPRGGTELEGALYRAMQTFPDEERNHKAIVLFTDGEDHEGDADRAAAEAAKRNIRIFTVGIGSPEGALIPIVDENGNRTYLKDQDGQVVKSRLDEVVLQKIALATNGAYKRMTGGEDTLGAIYAEASKIEAKTLESRQEKRAVDRFQWFVAAGLVLLALDSLLPEARRRREKREEVVREAA
jgi:Ca-activated chloride channel family protein